MSKAELNTTLINSYFELLRKLSVKGKEALILRLTKSINKKKAESSESIFTTFGAFQSEKSADEIIEEIKDNRTFNRNIPDF